MFNARTKVFLTSLAKYNEGKLVGEWVSLSEGWESVSSTLKKILGNDEEYFITDFEADFQIGEYDNLQELVTFASLYDKLEEGDKIVAIYWSEYAGLTRQEVIEMIQNETLSDNCVVYEASNERELGEVIAENMDIPEHLQYYIDYEKIGHDEVCNGATQIENYYIVSF